MSFKSSDEIKSLLQEVNNNPADSGAYFSLAMFLQKNGYIEKAIRCYEKLIDINPEHVAALNNLSGLYSKQNQPDRALFYIGKAIIIAPGNSDLYNNQGNILYRLDMIDLAVSSYRKAISCMNASPEIFMNLGKVLEETGDLVGATESFRKALDISKACHPSGRLFDGFDEDYFDCREKFADIQGFLHNMEGYILMSLSAKGPETGAVVEIGSFMGRSTCWLAEGSKKCGREKVTAIDHFCGSLEHKDEKELINEGTTFKCFSENLRSAGLDDYVMPIVAGSEQAAQNWSLPIRLLFIDGDHSLEGSERDFSLWSPFVVTGGLIVFHDIGAWDGVSAFYNTLMNASKSYSEVFSFMSLRVIEKR